MYNNSTNYLNTNKNIDIENLSFKTNNKYCGILEHVSFEYGEKYLNLILTEFSNINIDKIINYCALNDKYGNPRKEYFSINNFNIHCSPTSLRYVYHSLLILKYIETNNCNNIVEVGCGYGGLCLAINFFTSEFNVKLHKYYMIDLKEPLELIEKYISKHKEYIYMDIEYHDNITYGKNIQTNNLFFISNYCYTEISNEHNKNYTDILLPKIKNGFIIWQNGGNKGSYPISDTNNILKKQVYKIEEERPQTDAGYDIYKNYFVYF